MNHKIVSLRFFLNAGASGTVSLTQSALPLTAWGLDNNLLLNDKIGTKK
jgi:hypothetical protein